jgi:heme-degrading monooxygenase HmoA
MFLILWEYDVKQGCEEQFERVYAPSGDWAQLFRRDPAYERTLLLRDVKHAHKYLTCDFWKSREAYGSFQIAHRDAYSALDKKCEELTAAERKVGTFEQLAEGE